MIDNLRSPYPGLRSFGRDESDLFFGRESCIDQMVDKLAKTRFLSVLGASGSGKSSLVRTGLLDALDLGLLAQAGSKWSVAIMRPGDRPIANMARSLLELSGAEPPPSRLDVDLLASFLTRGPRAVEEWCEDGNLPADQNLLLLVDQFEELFRYSDYSGREEAEAFISLLLASALAEKIPIYVVITMRSEFLGPCAMFPGLAERINQGLYLTPRMTREEIREAIEGPAAVCGFTIEPALVNLLLNDLTSFAPWQDEVGTDQSLLLSRRADQLPLMQHVLSRMWMRSVSTADGAPIRISLSEYIQLGGLSGALDFHAREVLASLMAGDLPCVGIVFRMLTSGSLVDTATRRPCRLADLIAVSHDQREAVIRIVEVFRARGCNFLTPPDSIPLTEDTIIDISHESLIRQWGALREWLHEERQSAETYRHIEQTALLWAKQESGLLTKPYLPVALEWRRKEYPNAAWARRYGGDFNLAMRFLDASARRRNHRRTVAVAAVTLLFVGSGAFGVAQFQAARSNEQKLMSVQNHLQQLNSDLELANSQLKELNFADEMTDYGVVAKSTLEPNYGSKTPKTIPGGTVIFTKDLSRVINSNPPPIMIDAFYGGHPGTIPGALRIAFAGTAGTFDDTVQHRLGVRLDNLTNGDRDRKLIFFCEGSICWESYNASLRALHAGYKLVYWYRGGLASWQAGGFQTENARFEADDLANRLVQRELPDKLRWAYAISLSEVAGLLYDFGGAYHNAAISYEQQAFQELRDLPDSLEILVDYIMAGAQLWGHLNAQKNADSAFAVYADLEVLLIKVANAKSAGSMELRSLAAAVEQFGAVLAKPSPDRSLVWDRAARQIWEKLAFREPEATLSLRGTSRMDRAIGSILLDQNKPKDALASFAAAEATDRSLVKGAPRDNEVGANLSEDLYGVGCALEKLKQFDEAGVKFNDALSTLVAYFGGEPDDVSVLVGIALIDNHLGSVLRSEGKRSDAFKTLRRGIDVLKVIYKKDSDNSSVRSLLRTAIGQIGGLSYDFERVGDFTDALEAANEALKYLPGAIWIQAYRAHALLFQGHQDEAREIYLAHIGQKMDDGSLWDDNLRADFADLRNHGFSSPVMDEVEAKLPAPKPADARLRDFNAELQK